MDGLRPWLSEHFVELIGAIASLIGAGILIEQRLKRPSPDIGAELKVFRDREFGCLIAQLTINRPATGFYEIDRLEALGFLVAEKRNTIGFDPAQLPPGEGRKALEPFWQVGASGDHQVARFTFWVIDAHSSQEQKLARSSTASQNVVRVRLSITLKAAKTLRSKITVTSNRIA